MRCAILLSNLNLGGAERVALNLANGLQWAGCDIDLVLADRTGELLAKVDPKVRTFDLAAGRGRRAVLAFRRYVRSERPDVVMPITYEMNLVAALALLGLPRRPRLFITVHNPLRRFDEAGAVYKLAAMGLSRALYPTADLVITVSRGIADELMARKWAEPERIRTIHNPVITDEMEELARAEPPDLRKEVPAVVNVGRLVPQKNQLLLVEAFKLVTDKRPAQLWIVGEGPCRAELEKRIDELGLTQRVRLFGQVSNPLPIVREADVFVLSSTHEGFGNVLVEAMWTGTPVVATDCAYGPAEILENGKWGKLAPPGDAEALAAAIVDVLDNGGIDARKRAEDFTADKAVGNYLALITEEAGKGRRT